MNEMKIKRIFASLMVPLVLSIMLITSVEAAEFTGNYNYANEKLTVTGSNAAVKGLISVYVLESSVDVETLTDLNGPAVVDAFLADENGGFVFEIFLPSTLTTGKYKVNIANGTSTWESSDFTHINSGELADLVNNVNDSVNATEVESWLTPLNIALELPDLAYASEYLFAVKPENGYTDNQLQTEMQRSTAFYLLQQGETPENLVSYKAYLKDETLDIDCLEQYKNMAVDAKSGYLAKVAAMNLKTLSALEDIYGVGLIENSMSAASWQDLRNIIQGESQATVFFTKRIAEGTDYSKLTYPEIVYQELYRDRARITDMHTLKTLFASTATACYNNEKAAKDEDDGYTGDGSGSGGGGGGNISSWGPNASQTIQKIEEEIEKKAEETQKLEKGQDAQTSLNDISNHWGETAIKKMVDLGVVSGYPDGSFRPDNSVSRAEYIKLLCELFDIAPAAASSFSDVKSDDWYAPYVKAAAAAKIIQGDESGNFNPNAPVARQDAAVILGRLLKLTELSIDGKFTDGKDIASYASGYVAAMADAGLINGIGDGSYAPLSDTTRAQVVTMLLNAKNWVDNNGNGGADK